MSVPPSPDPFSTNTAPSFNGYHLLNEVSTGGTLSSLFSILSLFTEDIKLPWGAEEAHSRADQDVPLEQAEEEEEEDLPTGRPPTKSRTNSDVSQLDENIVGRGAVHRDSDSTVSGGDTSTIRDDDEMEHDGDRTIDASSTLFTEPDHHQEDEGLYKPTPPRVSRSTSRSARASAPRLGPTALSGTIARATVDTTLAVIPAEAFKKLTRKYPKASGTIVQVVLERFSRVTFMTGTLAFLPVPVGVAEDELTLSSSAQVSRPHARDPSFRVDPQFARILPPTPLFLHWRRYAVPP